MYFLSNTLHFWSVFGAIFLLATLAALFSERAGIINIAINGFMIIGATLYSYFGWAFAATSPFVQIPIFLLAALLTGVFSLIFYWFAVKVKSNHIIAGIAMNTLAVTFAVVVLLTVSGYDPLSNTKRNINWKFLRDLNLSEYLTLAQDPYGFSRLLAFRSFLTVFLAFLVWFVLEKTRWGLRFKAVGENPRAADSVGVNVFATQLRACFISGVLAAFAGQIFVSAVAVSINTFYGNVSGLGFISLTLIIIGRWGVKRVVASSLIFALIYSISNTIQYVPTLQLKDYSFFLQAAPFVITLLYQVFSSFRLVASQTSKWPRIVLVKHNSFAPAAVGKHYDPNKREV